MANRLYSRRKKDIDPIVRSLNHFPIPYFFTSRQPTIFQTDDPIAVCCITFRMRYLHDGYFIFLIEFLKQLHNFYGLFGMQITGRFIGKNHLWVVYNRSCNTYQLLLPP